MSNNIVSYKEELGSAFKCDECKEEIQPDIAGLCNKCNEKEEADLDE